MSSRGLSSHLQLGAGKTDAEVDKQSALWVCRARAGKREAWKESNWKIRRRHAGEGVIGKCFSFKWNCLSFLPTHSGPPLVYVQVQILSPGGF